MHGGGGISGNGIYNNLKRDSYMPCEAMALSPKSLTWKRFEKKPEFLEQWNDCYSYIRY